MNSTRIILFRLYEESVKAVLSGLDVTTFGKAGKQEMKVDHSGKRPPRSQDAVHLFVVGRPLESQQLSDSVACTNVVAGKNMKAADSSEQEVVGSPAADPAKMLEKGDCSVIAHPLHLTQVEPAGDCRRQLEHGLRLLTAQPKAP